MGKINNSVRYFKTYSYLHEYFLYANASLRGKLISVKVPYSMGFSKYRAGVNGNFGKGCIQLAIVWEHYFCWSWIKNSQSIHNVW